MHPFRVVPPLAFKLPPLSHQLTSCSSPNRHTTFGVNITVTSNAPADQDTSSDGPPAAVCPVKEVRPATPDIRLNGTANLDASSDGTPDPTPNTSALLPNSYPHNSVFPVFGPFDLLSCIQTGAYASAWAARDQSTGLILCLKTFRSLVDTGIARSVQTELRLFRRVVRSKAGERGKQFIIELNRSFQHHTNVFFAMELMTTDLGNYLYTEPEKCKEHAHRWMAQMALGIQSLHDMGILHRDIKPENVLIDARENIRIIDFGLVYLSPKGKPLHQGIECAMDFLGTAPYMAPEILRNKGIPTQQRKYYGTAVDWWALGCILFELESQDHQLLFETEEDNHAYVAWTQKMSNLDETYCKFCGFDPAVVSLLEGLLAAHPSDRFSLTDMEKQCYFLHHDGTSEFDNAAARALERSICPELVPYFTQEDKPITVLRAAELESIYDWANLKWANVRR